MITFKVENFEIPLIDLKSIKAHRNNNFLKFSEFTSNKTTNFNELEMNSMKILWLINRNNPNDKNLENLVELKFLAIDLVDSRNHSRYLNRVELY